MVEFLVVASGRAADLLRQASIQAAADIAQKELVERYDFYWAVASSVATVLVIAATFLGFGAWKNIKASIKAEVINELRAELLASETFKKDIIESGKREITSAFDVKSARLERQIQLSKLQNLSGKVASARAFSSAERDALYQQLITLRDDTEIVSDIDYINSLEQVLDSFYGAALWDRVDELERELRDVIAASPGIVQTLALVYATRFFGLTDERETVLPKLQQYVKLLETHNIYGAAALYKLALALDASEPDRPYIAQLIADVHEFEQPHAEYFVQRLAVMSSDDGITENPTSRYRRVAAAFAKVAGELGWTATKTPSPVSGGSSLLRFFERFLP